MTDEETLSLTKIEKAHKVLEDLQRLLTRYRHISKELTEANGIAIEAIEKQIPKKVVRIHSKYQRGYNDEFLCPCCGKSAETDCGDPFENYGLDWCNSCGQKLDWSDDE